MICTRIFFGYIALWVLIEAARPFLKLTQLVWVHDLFVFGAACFGLLLASLAVEEWNRGDQ